MKLRITKAPTGETGIYEIGAPEMAELSRQFHLALRKGAFPYVRQIVRQCEQRGFQSPVFETLNDCHAARIKTIRRSPDISEITLTWREARKEAGK